MASHQASQLAPRGARQNPAIVVAILGIVASAWVWHVVDREAEDAHHARLQADADAVMLSLQERFRDWGSLLHGIERHVTATPRVTRQTWDGYLSAFDLGELPGLTGVAFVRRTDRPELEEIAARINGEYAGASFTPEPDRDDYRIALHVFPAGEQASFAVGTDFATFVETVATQDRARDTGELAMTPHLRHAAGPAAKADVMLFLPVYRTGMPLGTIEQRRDAFRGFVAAGVSISDLGSDLRTPMLAMRVGEGLDARDAIYDELRVRDASAEACWSHTGALRMGGHTWVVRFEPSLRSPRPWKTSATALAVGLGVTSLTTGLVWSLGTTRRRALALADEMTHHLRESETRFRSAFEDASVGMALVAPDGTFLRVNPALCKLVGYTANQLLAWKASDITHPDDQPADADLMARVLSGELQTYQLEKRYIRKDGDVFWGLLGVSLVRDEAGEPVYFVAMVQDIADRKRMEDQLRHLAAHDRLTGLPGRAVLRERLEQCVARAQRWNDYEFAVLFLDLDGFKQVNDTIGHRAGDELLVQVADRLQSALRQNDVIARRGNGPLASRYGGDEFVVLLDRVAHADDAAQLAARLRQVMGQPYKVADGQTVLCPPSIGIATSADKYATADAMLHAADQAMYADKARRKAA